MSAIPRLTYMRRRIGFACSFVALSICSLTLFAQNRAGPSGVLTYRHAGEIWIQRISDSVPIQISQGGGEYPKWSPSGQWLSFRQNGKFIVTPVNGNRRESRVLEEPGVWSPVRGELALADQDGLSVIAFDGDDPQKRVVIRAPKCADIQWSPDGTRIAVLVNAHLWRLNAEGSDPRQLFSATGHDSLMIRGWSSDARHIIVSVDPDSSASLASDGLSLTFVPVDGGHAHIFASNVLLHADAMSISPDRAEALVSGGCCREAWTNKRVTLVNPASGKFTLLTSARLVTVSPSWSTDGSQIVFVSAPETEQAAITGTIRDNHGQISPRGANGAIASSSIGGGEAAKQALARRRIWIMNADGSRARQLTADSSYRDEYPVWTKHGQYILFARIDASDKASIWSVNLNNGMSARVVDQIDDDDPSLNAILRSSPNA